MDALRARAAAGRPLTSCACALQPEPAVPAPATAARLPAAALHVSGGVKRWDFVAEIEKKMKSFLEVREVLLESFAWANYNDDDI